MADSDAASKIGALADALARGGGGDRDVIVAALQSIASAMDRVAPGARAELAGLVATYTADPDDKEAARRLGAFLLAARARDH